MVNLKQKTMTNYENPQYENPSWMSDELPQPDKDLGIAAYAAPLEDVNSDLIANTTERESTEFHIGGDKLGGKANLDITGSVQHGAEETSNISIDGQTGRLSAVVAIGAWTSLGIVEVIDPESGASKAYIARLNGTQAEGFSVQEDDEQKSALLDYGQPLTFGRNPEKTSESVRGLMSTNDMAVSSTHMSITRDGDQIEVTDLHSSNGTTVNGLKSTLEESDSKERGVLPQTGADVGGAALQGFGIDFNPQADTEKDKKRTLEDVFEDVGIPAMQKLRGDFSSNLQNNGRIETDEIERYNTQYAGVDNLQALDTAQMLHAAIIEGITRAPSNNATFRPFTEMIKAMDGVTENIKMLALNTLNQKAQYLADKPGQPSAEETRELNNNVRRQAGVLADKIHDTESPADKKVLALVGIFGMAGSAEQGASLNGDDSEYLLSQLAQVG